VAVNKAIANDKGNKFQRAESKSLEVHIVGSEQIDQVDSLSDPENQKDQLNKQEGPLNSHVRPKVTIAIGQHSVRVE
jgi:hypothetical protein